MAIDFNETDAQSPNEDSNIDSSLTMNTPGLEHLKSSSGVISDDSFALLSQEAAAALAQTQSLEQVPASPSYTPAKLFQATGDVRNLARSESSPSGFTVQIYDRHIRTWVSDINFSDIAIRGQLYTLWKAAWLENADPPQPVDREMILEAAALTLADIQKDHNKWERNYSAARRRDWHPNFTAFYDDVFKGAWAHGLWPQPATLPEPPRFLAEMARRLPKSAGVAAALHSSGAPGADLDTELSMSPTAMRALKLRVIELEGLNQGLREELGISPPAIANASSLRRRKNVIDPGKL
jgi:hypothetical protein